MEIKIQYMTDINKSSITVYMNYSMGYIISWEECLGMRKMGDISKVLIGKSLKRTLFLKLDV